jgi:hypothetical protein
MLMCPIKKKKLEGDLFGWADPVGQVIFFPTSVSQVSTWVAACPAQQNFGVVPNFTIFC